MRRKSGKRSPMYGKRLSSTLAADTNQQAFKRYAVCNVVTFTLNRTAAADENRLAGVGSRAGPPPGAHRRRVAAGHRRRLLAPRTSVAGVEAGSDSSLVVRLCRQDVARQNRAVRERRHGQQYLAILR